MPQKTVIIIAGPTAVGKTAAGIELAKHFDTEIISADSRQCYKELNIGVSRPAPAQLNTIPHHFIATHSINDVVTAATFEHYAIRQTATLFNTKDVVLMVGGTGLYMKAFTEGLDQIPIIPDDIRNTINEKYKQEGISWLQHQVHKADPSFFISGEIKNPRRLIRALEVVTATGQSILSFRKDTKTNRNFSVVKIGLQLTKEVLHQHINKRVEEMKSHGLEEEVRALVESQHFPALQTVGYRELFSHFRGDISREAAFEQIKIHTVQYAKRQLTWFRKDKEIHWMEPDSNALVRYAGKFVDV